MTTHAYHGTSKSSGNMKSALLHPGPINEYLDKEVRAGRVLKMPEVVASQVHTSRFGVIPKDQRSDKWRLIVDLSSPATRSVNDGISQALCSMHYATFDEAVQKVVASGSGARLAKTDVEQAYRIIPVHPENRDRHLLGMAWEGEVYVDAQLLFGLRSAPMIFSAIADALEWIVHDRGISYCMHYLDDFLTVGPAESDVCERNFELLKSTCKDLGVPLKLEKVESPATTLVFLGIQLDTVAGVSSTEEAGTVQNRAMGLAAQESI